MATAAEAEAQTPPSFFSTRAITFIGFTALLIFSQNMFAVTSQIGVGDWEFWIDWKDYGWAPFVYTFAVATHFPVYAFVFFRFFNIYFGATLTWMFWFLQRVLMVELFFVGMNNYPFNFVQLPSYALPALAADGTLLLFGLRKHMGLYVLVASSLAGLLVVPGHFLFLQVNFLQQMAAYPDPLVAGTTHNMPVWELIRMVIPKPVLPAYISETWTWPLAYRSFFDPAVIMTGNMAVMGMIWAGPAWIFLKAIFWGLEKTTKRFTG